MKKIRILLCTCFVVFLVFSMASCGLVSGAEQRFDGYSLQITTVKERYDLNESVIIQIIERKGSPQGYNVYLKLEDAPFALWKKADAKNSFSLTLDEYGTYTLKIVAVVDNIEQANQTVSVNFWVSLPVPVENIFIKNSIIDLYFGENGSDSFPLKNLDVVYLPSTASNKGLGYLNTYLADNDFEIKDGAIRAKGYTAGKEPYVLRISSNDNGAATANLYVRINNKRTKSALTNFYVGYIDKVEKNNNDWEDKVYRHGDWVSFQCVEHAGMQQASGYEVHKPVGEGYVALGSADLAIVSEHGNVYYKVKLPEQTGSVTYRFYALIGGTRSEVYKDVTLEVKAPPVKPSSIILNNETVTLLSDQHYDIGYTVLPENAEVKSVVYEVSSGGSEYISVTSGGRVTAKKPTVSPVTVTVRASANSEAFAEIEISIIELTTGELVTHSRALTQQIDIAQNIVFELNPAVEDIELIKWYKDGVLQSQVRQYTYIINRPDRAGTRTVKAEVKMTGQPPIFLELPVTLQSCFEFTGLDDSYELNSEVELSISTAVSGASVLWKLCTAGGSELENISGNSYTFNYAGDYRIMATLSQGGTPIETKLSSIIYVSEKASHELFNVSVNGYFDGLHYAPEIIWEKLNEGVSYTVEIRKGAQTPKLYNSADPLYADNFSAEGFKLPYEDFKLSDSFDYRIKTSVSNRYTGFRSYGNGSGNAINEAQYDYLNAISNTSMNRYINSVFELGKVLNYLKVFRPEELSNGSGGYAVKLYFAIEFDARLSGVYGAVESSQTEPSIKNAHKLIIAANRAYGEGVGMNLSFSAAENGGVRVVVTPETAPEIDIGTLYDDTNDRLIYIPRYEGGGIPRASGGEPILLNDRTMSVATSSQLYLAALWGYRPIPAADSVAEEIYVEAFAILQSIIKQGMTDAEKTLAIYDYLTMNVAYDDDLYESYMTQLRNADSQAEIDAINRDMNKRKSFHLEGSILQKVAVCDGISKAFVLLCAIEDISCLKLSGEASNNGGPPVNHAWNIVMLGGEWHYIDATWGRWRSTYGGGPTILIGSNHYYFMATDSEMSVSHTFKSEAPIAARTPSYYYFDNDDEPIDLYFEDEAEFDAFIALLPTLGNIYEEFVIAYDFGGDLKSYVQGKVSGGNVFDKGVIVLYIVMR